MKKVLLISTRPPYPLYNGSAIRTFQAIEFFHKMSYTVDVLYLTTQKDNLQTDLGLKKYCRNVYSFYFRDISSYWNVFRSLFYNMLPLQVNYYYFKKVRKWIKEHVSEYDLFFCNNIRSAEYIRDMNVYKIIDFVDAISMNYEKAVSKRKGLWHYIYKIDHKRCLKYERCLLNSFDKYMIISETDRDYILSSSSVVISVIENYVRISDKLIIHQAGNHNIVFVGTMNYEPNISAVTYFVNEVMPLLLIKYPDVRFHIVGNKPSLEVLDLISEHIFVTGFVTDVWNYLKQSAVVAIPMLSGAGIQNKILEAMSVGACVVTTPIGFEGLKNSEGAPFVARSTEEMVVLISEWFESVEQRTVIGMRAKQYVQDNYSEENIFAKFKSFIGDNNSNL